MPHDARELGIDRTVEVLRRLLVERFPDAPLPPTIDADAELFGPDIGLNSLDGMDLLAEIESQFGVRFTDIDAWVDQSPTLRSVASYLVDHSAAESPRRN